MDDAPIDRNESLRSPLRPGVCSVTYRTLPIEQVAQLAADAGVRGIEWGGDVHAPPGDPEELARVRRSTAEHGLSVASYGSYFRAGPHTLSDFLPVLEAAVALGAPRIRIWAGAVGSQEAGEDGWRDVVTATRAAARAAAERGVELGFEFHNNTLTDSVDATLRLLDAVDAPNVTTYWQPPLDAPDEQAVAGLARLLERVCALHVFSWWPGDNRLRLADRADLWREAFRVASGAGRPLDALLEFVPDDDPDLLAGEAATLRSLLDAAPQPSG